MKVREAMKARIMTTIISLLLVFSYSEVRGVDWIYIGTINNDSIYYDRESISHPDINIVKFWEKIDRSDMHKFVSLNEINCERKTHRILSATQYNETGMAIGRGKLKGPVSADTGWEDIIPGSVRDRYYSIFCK